MRPNSPSLVLAGIDVGSHSTRLLVERDEQTLVRTIESTKLGQGMNPQGPILEPAMERVRAALAHFRNVMDDHKVDRFRIAATAAARDASNSAEFQAMVEETVGQRAEILSGIDEAEMMFLGATAELDPADGPFLVVDLGGRSTEFAYGANTVEATISTDMGSVRFSDEYLESDPPEPEELLACISVAGAWLDDVDREMPQAQHARRTIGVAGTVAAAVSVELGLAKYDRRAIHHFELTKEAAEDVFRTLATESREDRAWNPGLGAERVDTIVGGLAILVKIMRHYDLDSILASETDLLDGLVWSLR